ncbi:ABC transporter permease [Bradyrhizobium sp. BR13661]|uniref:ABC transporter permease n=1 Tax=Bradyrhizobium sp. BR13661 TaxID=2940622 RepID=UPI0024757B4A|nr:ABC transporter permease [Bradyrhizobium sp. BR13661]MDH6260531.1 peptide/nickel transport system permease protein [Bradyrhizobium sp. BR13661]
MTEEMALQSRDDAVRRGLGARVRSAARRFAIAGSGVLATMFAISIVSFLLVALLPGDLPTLILGDAATPGRVAVLRESLGLDQPLIVRYFRWLGNVLSGDLGRAVHSGEPTLDTILSRLPVTLELIVMTQIVALAISVPLGVLSAHRRGSTFDSVTLGCCLMLLSIPAFVVGLCLIYGFALHLQWLPATGYVALHEGVLENLRSMILPVLSLALIEVPIYLRLLRTEMIGTLQQNYIALARGMGLRTTRILFENALRPSSLNLITAVGINMGRLMGGAIIIEQMFALPGIGQLLVQSIYQQEYLMTQGIVLFVGVMFIMINLLTDIVYAIVDPRLLHDGG